MKNFMTCLLFTLISFYGISQPKLSLEHFEINSSIRAIDAISETEVWFAGSKGMYGFTEDGGKTWTIDSIKIDDKLPEFRSIAVTDQAVHILTIASPGVLLRSVDKGKSWKEVYREEDDATFYDAMDFGDNNFGIAVGDPVDGCLSIIISKNGGTSWEKVPCSKLPDSVDGEGCFAASDTNVKIIGNHAWIGTGGMISRIYKTDNMGETWSVHDVPLVQGGKMTGIFSLDFYDEDTGYIIGGDWESKDVNVKNKAGSNNGGKSWELKADGNSPGYRSCVQYIPNSNGKQLFTVGIPGVSFSSDGGNTWIDLIDESFYTIRFTKKRNFAWLAGSNKVTKMVWK